MNIQEFNEQLANACRACQAACCKKGLLFLPCSEYVAIADYLGQRDIQAQAEFIARSKSFGSFWLYDQQERCQFLDQDDFCRLHSLGLKPSECFWWPYHIYKTPAGGFEIRLSTSCCDGFKAHTATSPYPRWIIHKANAIGLDIISAFRDVYKGSYQNRFVAEAKRLTVGFLGVDDLAAYRTVGERLFPHANWDLGMTRYSRLLHLYPQGMLAARIGDDIVAYVTLWPVKPDFMSDFIAGRRTDDQFDVEALAISSPSEVSAWYITALAIVTDVRELRAQMRQVLYVHIRSCFERSPNATAFAEVATKEGDRFLRRMGFKPVADESVMFTVKSAQLTQPK